MEETQTDMSFLCSRPPSCKPFRSPSRVGPKSHPLRESLPLPAALQTRHPSPTPEVTQVPVTTRLRTHTPGVRNRLWKSSEACVGKRSRVARVSSGARTRPISHSRAAHLSKPSRPSQQRRGVGLRPGSVSVNVTHLTLQPEPRRLGGGGGRDGWMAGCTAPPWVWGPWGGGP